MTINHLLKTAAAASALALVAGAAQAGSHGPIGACLITKTDTNPFFVKMKEGALAGAEANGIDLQTFADGQHPFSFDNLSGVRRLADQYGVRLVLDASRIIENAWYIQRHEIGHGDRTGVFAWPLADHPGRHR